MISRFLSERETADKNYALGYYMNSHKVCIDATGQSFVPPPVKASRECKLRIVVFMFLCCIAVCCVALHCVVLGCVVLHCTVLWCVVNCIVLRCAVLCCAVLCFKLCCVALCCVVLSCVALQMLF